jgi:hypothetical protein
MFYWNGKQRRQDDYYIMKNWKVEGCHTKHENLSAPLSKIT